MQSSDRSALRSFEELCEWVNTPSSLGAYLRVKYSVIDDFTVDAKSYTDKETSVFFGDYLCMQLLSKWKGFQTGGLPKQKAIESFWKAERVCQDVNRRFATGVYDSRFEPIFHRAQRKIANILGVFDYAKLLDRCRWTGGATFATQRGSHFSDKMIQDSTVTASAEPYARAFVEADIHWGRCFIPEVDGPFCFLRSPFGRALGAKHLTVPKNAKTDRNIAKEPSMNIFLQKSVGEYIRARLRKHGLDLNTQSLNQDLASRAFVDGLATIDLSMASDTISCALIQHLLPIDWYSFLDDIRSKRVLIEGKWHRLHKFSSMGNGFTFELESLVFWALVQATVDEMDVSRDRRCLTAVFGDDIILPAECADYFFGVLSYAGFVVNTEKSFASGLFYESCGRHFFHGCDVTPVYQKELTDTPQELIRLHNRLYRLREQFLLFFGEDKILQKICQRLVREYGRLFGTPPRVPEFYTGDDGFLSDRSLIPFVNGAYRCRVLRYSQRIKHLRFEGAALAYKLYYFGHSNEDPQGYPAVLAGGRWLYTRSSVYSG